MDKQAIPTQTIGLNRANHVGIAVNDLEKSITFYKALTGQEPVTRDNWNAQAMAKSSGMDKVSVNWATFRLQNLNIDLVQFEEPKSPQADYKGNQPGAIHLCFEVDNINEVYERMQKAGITFKGPAYTVSPGDAKEGAGTGVAYFDGPDGEHLEVIMPSGPFVRAQQQGTASQR